MTMHATCVCVDGKGLLILGPSGAGKSSLALQMMGLGASLVADDRVELARRDDMVIARCPPPLAGLIEARGLGILQAEPLPEARVVLIADLSRPPQVRLPVPEKFLLLGCEIDFVGAVADAHFSASLVQYLRCGRRA
jgi:HPr kinase/phosphorylase